MNKLYRVLFVGAYIPYAILLSYYITRFYFVYVFILLLYIASSYAVLVHKPFLDKGILAWVRAKRVCELLLLSSFSIRVYYKSQFLTFVLTAVLVFVIIKVPKKFQHKCEHNALYVTICMVFLTNADIIGKMCTTIQSVLILYERQARNVNSANFEFAIERRIRQYHTLKLLQVYMVMLMEITLTKMNAWAVLIIILSAILYSVYAYLTLSLKCEARVSEYYTRINELPSTYPIPLDMKDAINNCELAKKLFKTHEI